MFSRQELQAISARADQGQTQVGDKTVQAAYLELEVAADYLEELLARQESSHPRLFEAV